MRDFDERALTYANERHHQQNDMYVYYIRSFIILCQRCIASPISTATTTTTCKMQRQHQLKNCNTHISFMWLAS